MANTSNCPYKLRSCVWEITLACCFSCKYCGSSGGKARPDELSTEQCLSIADQLSELGCRRVSLIGGEVFMRPDWDRIVDRLTSHGIRVGIITNGFLFTEVMINRLKAVNIESVAISLDGPEAIHDKYRQAGSYQRAKNAMYILAENSVHVSLISTLNQENVQHLSDFYETIQKWPIFAWQLQACSPMGNARKNRLEVDFDAQYVMDFIASKLPEAPFSIGIADNIGYFSENEPVLRGNPFACFEGCGAGIVSIGIDSVGNVRGCESMYDDFFIEGNLRERSLKDIWEDDNSFLYNRAFDVSMLTGSCAKCLMGPLCAGGCRSYNYFTNGGKLYENVLCPRGKRIRESNKEG